MTDIDGIVLQLMKSGFSERRRQSINVKHNSAHKSDHFSEVSQEGSREDSAGKESQDQQLGWRYFHDSKAAIASLVKELLPKYSEYRKILYQSLQQICQQANLQYDHSHLKEEPQFDTNLQLQGESIPLEEKTSTVEKIISERRIKKYYKNKHEVNFQDELDPEDDEREIYRFYQDTFFNGNGTDRQKDEKMHEKSRQAYNEQFLSPVKRQANLQQSKVSQPDNKILDLTNQYQIDESFQRMKYQNQQNTKRINYTKINDPFVGFEHQLSFDVNNQQFFVKSANRYQMDSFGLNDDDRNQVNSQINYDNQKMKKYNRSSRNLEKNQDQLSHADNIYKNFIERQNQELNKQKIRVEELTQKAQKVLNNDIDYDQPKNQEEVLEEDKISQMRYLLGEMMEVFSVEECLKFNLKFKSFQLLNKLYENASNYYNQEIVFEQPLEVKYMWQIVKAALPEQDQAGVRVIIHNMFGLEPSIAYEDFLERLTPSINDKEFQSLQSATFTTSSNKTFDLTVRLFNIWIEMEYFENQLRGLLEKNPELIDRFVEQTTENDLLMPYLIAEFVCRSKKFPKTKKIKAEIYFRKILGERLMISQFYRWVQSKSSKVNQNFDKHQQEEKYDYYYHLY